MHVRRRKSDSHSIDSEPLMPENNMTDVILNGNKVSDVNGDAKHSFMTSEKHNMTSEKSVTPSNKVSDVNKSPSISSQDSCTKLTVDKDDDDVICCSSTSKTGLALKSVICFVCGILFGIMFVKSRVFEPRSIRGQMVFENFIMLKMFLAAVCVGQIVFSILSVLPMTKKLFETAVVEYIACFSHKGILTSAIGAFALGCGMTLSGACPGMVLAQVGSWVPNAIFTLLGCLIGALTYGMVAPFIQKYTAPKKPIKNKTVNQSLDWPFIAIALPMSIALLVAIILLEYFWEYKKDIINIGRTPPPYDNIFTAMAWLPSVSGALIGLIQLPLIFTVHDTVGGSSSYVTLVSQWVVTKRLKELFPYLESKRCGLANWWQVFYVCGAVLGAALASIAADTMATSEGPTLHTAILGGILMLWGSRFAAGCTSGHGLSGMGLLAWLSFIAVPCMFAGGIITAFSMQATGALDDYVTSTFDT